MEPCRLYDQTLTTQSVKDIHSIMQGEGHIFNLGHGILQHTPVDHVKAVAEMVHEFKYE